MKAGVNLLFLFVAELVMNHTGLAGIVQEMDHLAVTTDVAPLLWDMTAAMPAIGELLLEHSAFVCLYGCAHDSAYIMKQQLLLVEKDLNQATAV